MPQTIPEAATVMPASAVATKPGVDKAIVTPQFPMFYDLSSDPHEDWNLFDTRLDNVWVLASMFRAIGQYKASVIRYPNIKPGEEFTGNHQAKATTSPNTKPGEE